MTEDKKDVEDMVSHIPYHIRRTLQEIDYLVHGTHDYLCLISDHGCEETARQTTCAYTLCKGTLDGIATLTYQLGRFCKKRQNNSTPNTNVNPA
jgi:hypothetical protein